MVARCGTEEKRDEHLSEDIEIEGDRLGEERIKKKKRERCERGSSGTKLFSLVINSIGDHRRRASRRSQMTSEDEGKRRQSQSHGTIGLVKFNFLRLIPGTVIGMKREK